MTMQRLANKLPLCLVLPALMSMCLMGCPDETIAPSVDAGPDVVAEAGADGGEPSWRVVLDKLDGALLSIWGASPTDVWAVGGPLGNSGFDAMVIRFDGVGWRSVTVPDVRGDAGVAKSYWWVHGTSERDVWLVGEGGRITHWDGVSFQEIASGTDATLFGVWAASPSDVWAVGGTPEQASADNDVVLHWDGSSWSRVSLPSPKGGALFKVWGTSSDNLYIVGEKGVIWHKKGGELALETAPNVIGRLTTVAGCSATEVYAVGGRDVLVSDGNTWARAPIDPLKLVNDVNGVSCESGHVVIVGGGSLKLRLERGTWQSDFGSEPFTDLHAAWADSTGAFWAAGGQFAAAARANTSRQGVIGRYARDVVSSTLAK